MYDPFRVNRFQRSILLIVQYKYLKKNHVPEILFSKIWSPAQDHAVLVLLLNVVVLFISIDHAGLIEFFCTTVLAVSHLSRRAHKYLYMIHRVGRTSGWQAWGQTQPIQLHCSMWYRTTACTEQSWNTPLLTHFSALQAAAFRAHFLIDWCLLLLLVKVI